MDTKEKISLITRNTQEIVGVEEIEKILSKRNLKVYIGSETSGRPHIGYFAWMMKVADLLNAGSEVTILLADLHAHLNDMKAPFELLAHRVEFYSLVFKEGLKSVGADIKKLKFVKGSDFQLEKDYCLDVFKMASIATVHDCAKATSEVVRQSENPRLGGNLYPILQALDEQYLDVDVQLGGVDQRKILMFARQYLPKLNYKERIEMMLPMIPGLTQGGKMSSSDANSKIDFLDDEKTIKKKLNKAYCPEGEVEGNGVLAFAKAVVMQIKEDKEEEFLIERPEKFGGNLTFKTYDELEKAFIDKKLHPMDLKSGVAIEINRLVEPIRKAFEGKEDLIKKAYPE